MKKMGHFPIKTITATWLSRRGFGYFSTLGQLRICRKRYGLFAGAAGGLIGFSGAGGAATGA